MAKCNYKDSLRGCSGNGIVDSQVIVHYNLRDYDNLYLCSGCTEKILIDALKDLEIERNKELSLYVFDLDGSLRATVCKDKEN